MKFKKHIIYTLIGALVLSVVLGIVSGVRVYTQQGPPDPNMSGVVLRKQASRWISFQTPFYYPFKTRGTYMQAVYPFMQQFGYMSRRNSNGFRTPEYTIAHPPNTFRVVIVGDGLSTANSLPIEQTYPYLLSKLMNKQCPAFQSEVIALTGSARRLTEQFITFEAHGKNLKPDLVVFQLSPSSLDFLDYMGMMEAQGVPVAKRFSDYYAKELKNWAPGSMEWETFLEVLDNLQKWSKANSVPVVFLIFPFMDGNRNGRNFNHYDPVQIPQMIPFQKVVDEITSQGFVNQYLLDTFKETAGDQFLLISQVAGEPNEYCHTLVASSLLETFNKHNCFQCSVSSKLRQADGTWKAENTLRQDAAKNWVEFNTSYARQLKFYQQLKKLYPNDPWVTVQLAETYFGLRLGKEGTELYGSLLKFAPNVCAPYYHLSRRAVGPAQERLLMQMIEAVPDHTASIISLGMNYRNSSRPDKACEMFQRAMAVPQNEDQYNLAKKQFNEMDCRKRIASGAADQKKISTTK